MSTKKSSEKSHLKLRFSASASNLQICTSPQSDLIDGYFGTSQTTFKNMFRLKRLNSKTLQKRNTFGSLWDLRNCANYKLSLSSPCNDVILPGERANGKVEKPSKGRNHSVRLLKSQSLKLLNSFSSCEDKYLRRLKFLWNYKHKSRCNKVTLVDRALVAIDIFSRAFFSLNLFFYIYMYRMSYLVFEYANFMTIISYYFIFLRLGCMM